MVVSESPEIDDAFDLVENKVRALEYYATRKHGELPPLPPIRNFKHSRGLYNAIESAIVRMENIADSLPRVVSTGRSHIQAKLIDYDPGERFQKQLNPSLQRLKQAAIEISKLQSSFGDACATILEQTNLFEVSINAEAAVISKASRMPKPSNPATLKEECSQLIDSSTDISDLKYDIDLRSPLYKHGMAMADAAAALGWVVAPASVKHAKDYKAIVNTLAEDILSRYIELGCNPIHSDFAEALNAIIDALATYVEKEHPAGLRWNYAQGAVPLGYRRAQREMSEDSHPIGDFYKLMHSGLMEFALVSRELGGSLKKISDHLIAAYEEMAKAIEVASNRARPQGDPAGALRMLLISVHNEMAPLITFLDKVKENERYYEHCIAFKEFVNCMQWSSATMQKMSPVGFIIDIETITLLYLQKMEEKWCKGESYVVNLHRTWAESLKKMMTELKEYVKTHHPNELMYDTRRSRTSIDNLLEKLSLDSQLNELRNKSTSKKWTRGSRIRMALGKGRTAVPSWVQQPEK